MNTKKVLLALIFVATVTVVSTTFIFLYLSSPKVIEYKMYLIVGRHLGFNVNNSALFFGTIVAGGNGTRGIIVSNDGLITRKVHVETSGKLANWTHISDNDFILQIHEKKSLNVTVIVPEDAEFSNYTGTLRLTFKKMM